jgi:hypothetical protein
MPFHILQLSAVLSSSVHTPWSRTQWKGLAAWAPRCAVRVMRARDECCYNVGQIEEWRWQCLCSGDRGAVTLSLHCSSSPNWPDHNCSRDAEAHGTDAKKGVLVLCPMAPAEGCVAARASTDRRTHGEQGGAASVQRGGSGRGGRHGRQGRRGRRADRCR